MKKTRKRGKATGSPSATIDAPSGSREDWEAKDALRTLTRGIEIQSNKTLMKRVKDHARSEAEAHKRVLRLEGKPL